MSPPRRVTLSEVPETPGQALVLALYLGLAAPDDDKAQAAGTLAEELAVGHRRVHRRALQSRRARAVRGRGAVAPRPPGVSRQTGRPGQAERGTRRRSIEPFARARRRELDRRSVEPPGLLDSLPARA